MKTHELKAWPHFFKEIVSGEKTCELRKDDRGYEVGDLLILREWNPNTKEYTGHAVGAYITHIIRINELPADLKSAMGLNPIPGSVNMLAILSIKLTRFRTREGFTEEASG